MKIKKLTSRGFINTARTTTCDGRDEDCWKVRDRWVRATRKGVDGVGGTNIMYNSIEDRWKKGSYIAREKKIILSTKSESEIKIEKKLGQVNLYGTNLSMHANRSIVVGS